MTVDLALADTAGALDKKALRRALGTFVTGVTIVTTTDEMGRPRGLTVNSFTSVSLDPPLVLVCIAKTSGSFDAFQRSSGFAINVLCEDQRSISDLFATKSPDKFDHVDWVPGLAGAPRILGSISTLECAAHERVVAGDHIILIGRVIGFEITPRRPLVYGQGGYISLAVQQAAIAKSPGRKLVVSCIVEQNGKVLMLPGENGRWMLPGAALTGGGSGDLVSLKDALRRAGAKVEITFLYSVFENASDDTVNIVYRGTLVEKAETASDVRFFDAEDMPWSALYPPPANGMLMRYFHERALDQFGIYTDIDGEARVARLTHLPRSWDSYASEFKDG
jgi:flavin reductase (DIM6/NTAB) family NADH-FMN oxidoreductase RutF